MLLLRRGCALVLMKYVSHPDMVLRALLPELVPHIDPIRNYIPTGRCFKEFACDRYGCLTNPFWRNTLVPESCCVSVTNGSAGCAGFEVPGSYGLWDFGPALNSLYVLCFA